MTKVVYRPYRGEDREERIESDAVRQALEALLPGQVGIADEFPLEHNPRLGAHEPTSGSPEKCMLTPRLS